MKKNKTNPLLPLYQKSPRRFFAFGCSFTKYIWPTWADITADALGVQYWNYAVPGVGNQYISNMVAQADNVHNFNSDDLIIVCWSHPWREDRFVNGKWINSRGNVFSNAVYSSDFTTSFCDPVGFLVRDLATIKLCKGFLESKNCQYHFIEMAYLIDHVDVSHKDIDRIKDLYLIKDLHLITEIKVKYRSTIETILPSFFQVLWNNSILKKERINRVNICAWFNDTHPTVMEHFNYLEKTFIYDFPLTTKLKVNHYHSRFRMANIAYSKKIKRPFNPNQITDTDYWEIINDSPFPKSNSLDKF